MTDLETLTDYLLAKPSAVEERPFGPDTMVFKVMGKMFALTTPGNDPLRVNLKCDPFLAQLLREKYEAVLPGYHMNKRHWNTIVLDGTIPQDEIQEMIDESYTLVVKGLKKKEKEKLLMADSG